MTTTGALPGPAGLLAGLGGLAALFGTYWDDAWHTDRGRDTFFIAPHITLYVGVTVTGLVAAWWLLRGYLAGGGRLEGVRAVLGHPPALLALLGATATLASAPIDNAWHELYGRDSVLWSPPHMLGVAGSAAMSVGLLAGMAVARDRLAPAGRLLLGAGVLGSFLVPVLEFDSDVPQFANWMYWPVATAGLVLFLLVVEDLTTGRWTATSMAAAFTAVKVAIVVALAVLDHSGSLIPPVLAVAVVDDVLRRRRVGALGRALAVSVLVPASWSIATALQPGQATVVPTGDVPLAVAGSVVAAVLVVLATGRLRIPRAVARPSVTALLVAATSLLLVVEPQRAWAHDPGQGDLVGQVAFDVDRADDVVTMTAVLSPDDHRCSELRPLRAVARRGVQERTAPLALQGCRATTALELPDAGRWFVYTEFTAAGDQDGGVSLEAWVPLGGGAERVREVRDLYLPTPDAPAGGKQWAAGAALYVVITALLLGAVRLARRTGEVLRQGADRAA